MSDKLVGQSKLDECSLKDQFIGSYRVVREIGRGGMATVHEAVQETIGKRVAIKVLFPALSANQQLATRFLNEARSVNIVQHPGLVNIFEFGRLPDRTAYIVMEYLEGESLNARLHRSGRLPMSQVLRLSRQIASALCAAHHKGIIHRDLKPANVMIVPDTEAPGGERAKVLDFGIAKLALHHAGPEGEHLRTQSGVFMGTPAYMAPEQCQGASGVDDRADVYSLGVIVYQLLSGQLPFDSGLAFEMMEHHVHTAPRELREVAPFVPPRLAQLVREMLLKGPAERPSMDQVLARLESLCAQNSGPSPAFTSAEEFEGAADPSSTMGSAIGQSRDRPHHQWTQILGALVSLVLLLLLGVWGRYHGGSHELEHGHDMPLPQRVAAAPVAPAPGPPVTPPPAQVAPAPAQKAPRHHKPRRVHELKNEEIPFLD